MNRLVRTSTLVSLFVLAMLLTLVFVWFGAIIDGPLLDSLNQAEDVRARVAELSRSQKLAHVWISLLADTVYPLAYGGFFAGMVMKGFPKIGIWLALPAFIVIPIDLSENIIQAAYLTGASDMLSIKAVLTPLKFSLFGISALLAVLATVVMLMKRVRNSNAG